MTSGAGERSWVRIEVTCPPEAADSASAALLALSPHGLGVEEDADSTRLTAYVGPFAAAPDLSAAETRARAVLATIPPILLPRPCQIKVAAVPETDWIAVFRAQHRPVRIGHIVIKPTWERWPSSHLQPRADDIVIELDPGLAFGTGLHPTTAGCLLELQERLRRGDRVIDFGTGSGILAIAAARLGAGQVLALDCDPSVVTVAQENVRRNAVEERVTVRRAEDLTAVGCGWALVLANISPPLVVREAPAALRALRPGGAYVCAGIPLSREQEVLEALREVGFEGIVPRIKGEWISYVCVAPREGSGRP
ncbi:MAG: 50S ribosomal protein L11 methyltransferase [Armatimonadota bacterium]